jgi:hypothetical protein
MQSCPNYCWLHEPPTVRTRQSRPSPGTAREPHQVNLLDAANRKAGTRPFWVSFGIMSKAKQSPGHRPPEWRRQPMKMPGMILESSVLHGANFSFPGKFALELGLLAEMVRSEVFVGRASRASRETRSPGSISAQAARKTSCRQDCTSPLQHPSTGSLCDAIRLGSVGHRRVT